ncbi:MAG: DUF933 domain-containing protein [Candidatus Aminicenantia bacterium]
MKVFITGLQGAGKTTLFRILTSAEPDSTSWIAEVEDERLFALHRIYPEKKITKIKFEYHDFPPLPTGGKTLSNYLDSLKLGDLIIYVIKNFNGGEPFGKIREFEEELRIMDLAILETSIANLEKDLKKVKSTEKEREHELLLKIKKRIEEGIPIREISISSDDKKLLKGFAFLSLKPVLYAINLGEDEIEKIYDESLRIKKKNFFLVPFSGKLEFEISQLDSQGKEEFMKEFCIKDFARERVEKAIFECMELVKFYTIGKDEVRSWLIPLGTKALKAAGLIHTDMEKGFIRAEVISFDELIRIGSLKEAREHGLVRIEGKDYIVKDGDILYIRFTS